MMPEMQVMRIVAVGLAWAGLLGPGAARAGTEAFAHPPFGAGPPRTTATENKDKEKNTIYKK